jgi:hypothetical protein
MTWALCVRSECGVDLVVSVLGYSGVELVSSVQTFLSARCRGHYNSINNQP